MPDLPDTELLIGVDGGASEVKAHQVLVLSDSESAGAEARFAPSLALGSASASCCYDRVRGFEPESLADQLRAFEEKRVIPTPLEIAEGDLWIDAFANTIGAVATEAEQSPVRVGLCVPGLKTADGRGLAVVRNGPRMPDFLDRLERRLAHDGLVLAGPMPRLLSDGDACGIGERVHAQGMLRGISNAYYIGGGTGLAETLLLSGEVVSFDALSGWIKKAWALECAPGETFEDRVSMGGINAAYARRSGQPLPVHEDEFPEQRAVRGDAIALEVMREAAEALAELVFSRVSMLSKGRKPATRLPHKAIVSHAPSAHAGGAAEDPPSLHMRPRTFLQRVVFGQRLAHLFADEDLQRVFRDVVEAALAQRIERARDPQLAAQYLSGSNLKEGFLYASSLRAAPALGAAAAALEAGMRAARKPEPREKAREMLHGMSHEATRASTREGPRRSTQDTPRESLGAGEVPG